MSVLPNAQSPISDSDSTGWQKLKEYVEKEATFFRVHLCAFTFIPLICSGIFYASNGEFHINYLDSLFLCYSAMTVTGLSVVNLSTLTAWQQVILYLLMLIGDLTMVAWIMVLVRKEYFKRKCEFEYVRRKRPIKRTKSIFETISGPFNAIRTGQNDPLPNNEKEVQDVPGMKFIGPTPAATMFPDTSVPSTNSLGLVPDYTSQPHKHARFSSDDGHDQGILDGHAIHSSPEAAASLQLSPVMSHPPLGVNFTYTTSLTPSAAARRRRLGTTREGVPIPHRTMTVLSSAGNPTRSTNQRKYQGLGGFPGPFELAKLAARRVAPSAYRKMERKMTMPYTTTIEGNKTPWLNFDLLAGRNSDFYTETLTDDQLESIGGAEYLALRYLSYMVPLYFIGTQLVAYLLFAPWISVTHGYDHVFEAQPRLVQKPWFSLFQVMGAYTGGGLSLVDQGMLPFQQAYLMIFALIFVILAGNHALPIFYDAVKSLRLIIWIGSRVAREGSDAEKAFSFLLDHPRRCFIYLFPSHQTWFLVICLVLFSTVEWILFEVLDLGLEAYESLPVGVRIICGLFQGLAARASGFSIVSLASFAPALQFLYVVMMYIAIYPIAISIRSTNTYEEQSLGVFEQPPENEDEEPQAQDLKNLDVGQRVHRYVGWHLRKQMSVDIWWLVWGVFLVTIIERGNIMDQDKKWFDTFRILFELVSAFGGIGLSLGVPYDNFSFVGAMRPLSKLVIIVIMVRGRHRGLPVAVDRAVMLPNELMQRNQREERLAQARQATPQERTPEQSGLFA